MTEKERKATFVIQKVQPALLGLMDGSVSTLAPIFATAGLTGQPIKAFYVAPAATCRKHVQGRGRVSRRGDGPGEPAGGSLQK